MTTSHPYYPRDLHLPNYVPNDTDNFTLVSTFFAGVAVVLATAVYLVAAKRTVAGLEKGVFVWFVICGFIHTFFEGYFGLFHKSMAGDNTLFGQLWKEYALADSRYLVGDPSVLYIERITAFIEGPLCIVAARAILKDLPYRHPLQICISLGQLYGTILYFATSIHENNPHCSPKALHFWFYFTFLNFLWLLIPSLLIRQSYLAMTRGMTIAKQAATKGTKTKANPALLAQKEQ